VITSGFLHGGFIHLGLNMFVLYILGTLLEPAIGSRRLVAIYFVSLVAGSFGALLLSEPYQYTVGASGAIYGLFGATLLVARHRGLDQVVSQLGFWLVLNLVLTFSISGISIGGHLGGLAGGVLAGLVVVGVERRRAKPPVGLELGALAVLGLAVFVACVAIAGSAAGPGI
jgi:membrane associated rhomboid family serine protease